MKRMRWIQGVLMMVVLSVATACAVSPAPAPSAAPAPTTPAPTAPAPAAPKTPLKVIYGQAADSMNYAGVYLAENLGYFKEEGVDFELVHLQGGATIVPALLNQNVHFGGTAVQSAFSPTIKGQRIIIGVPLLNGNSLAAVVRKEIYDTWKLPANDTLEDRIKNFKGLKITITSPGSGGDRIIRQIVTKYGLDPDKDVDIIPTKDRATALAAFERGLVDVLWYSSPAPEEMVSKGLGVMVMSLTRGDVEEFNGMVQIIALANPVWIDKNREAAERFVRAIYRAHDYIRQNPEKSKDLIYSNFSNLDRKAFDLAWDAMIPALAYDPVVDKVGLQKAIDFFSISNPEFAALTYEDLTDVELYTKAKVLSK